MAREPTVGGDNNNWGTVLNTFLSVSHNADGTLILNSLPSNVQMDGTQSQGGTAVAGDAGHAHPAPAWVPGDNGLFAAAATLDSIGSGAISIAGTLYLNRIPIRYGFTTGTIWVVLSAGGNASPTSTGTFAGLYSLSAGSFTLIGTTNDIATSLTGTGAKNLPLVSSVALTAGQVVYGAIVTNFNTTQPTFRQYSGASAPSANLNLTTTTNARCVVNGTTFTSIGSLPTPLSASNNTVSTANPYWMGLS